MAPNDPRSDTTPTAKRVQLELYRKLTPTQKAACIRDVTRSANALALAGLRTRHPDADEHELFLRLAASRLGADVVRCVYGWSPDAA